MAEAQLRAHRVLTRLATSMQRCVTKANGEMAYQLLYQQEAFVTFTGYQMFTRFVSFAIDECRNAAVVELQQLYPEHTVLTVNAAEPVVDELVALDTVGVVAAEDSHQPDLPAERSQRFVSHNQKDDYVHRPSWKSCCVASHESCTQEALYNLNNFT